MLGQICPHNLLVKSFFYSEVKPIFCFNIQNQKHNEKTSNRLCKIKMPGKRKKRIFEEIADELFSLNTQVSTNNSHELGGKVKRSATSFSWAGEMGHWRDSRDGFFPTNKWTHKQNKTTKVERQIIALLLKSLLAFSLHIFILKCGYISKILWKHSIHSCNAETTL